MRLLTAPRAIRLLLALLVAAVAFSIYLPARHGDFVFDDRKLIVENEELWRPDESLGAEFLHAIERMGGIFRPEEEGSVRTAFRPVRFASLRLDVRLTRALGLEGEGDAEPSPLIFHLHNALLHALNALLLAFLVALVRPSAPLWFPALFALAFALHPVQTESVAYISGRRDVLFLAFYLLALIVYAAGRRDGGWGRGLFLAVLTWCALGTKEMAVTLPVAMVLLEGLAEPHPGDRPGRQRAIDRLPLWLPSLLTALVFSSFLLTRQNPGGGTGWWGGTPLTAFFGAGRALLEYLRLLVVPHNLSVDYSYDAFPASSGALVPWTGIVSVTVIAALVVVAWRRRLRDPELATSIILFLVLIAPVAQLIPHPERFAEHHLYLPSLAFLAAAAALLRRPLARAREASLAGIVLVMFIWGGLGLSRLDAWADPYHLWKSAAESYPRCARAHFGWGNAAWQRGQTNESLGALRTAVELLERIDREPLQQGYYLQALQIRAGILATTGLDTDLHYARAHLETLLGEKDTDGSPVAEDPVVWSELVKVRERLDDREGALAAAEKVLTLDAPSTLSLEASLYIAAARAEQGDFEGSEVGLLAAMERATDDRERALVWYQLGIHRQQQEKWIEALDAFERAEAGIGATGRRSSARYKRAECLLHLQRIGAARTALEDLLADEPGHLPSLLSLGEIVLGAGEWDDAERIFLEVLNAAPQDRRAREGLGRALARKKMRETPEARPADPTRATALSLLADRLEAEGRLADAIDALIQAETHCEGPAERDRRVALRLRIARLHRRASFVASRQENESLAIAELQLAVDAYETVRTVAAPEQRGAAALEAADVVRVLSGATAAYHLLYEEWSSGVREPRLVSMLAGLAERAEMWSTAAEWFQAVLDDPESATEMRTEAEKSLIRLREREG